MNYKLLAEKLFPNLKYDREYYENKYKKRQLKENEVVVRFGPSPTGFLHIGGLRTALINNLYARKNGGVYYFRIEDTDQERKVENADILQLKGLNYFGINFDEGLTLSGVQQGEYGPYRQSERIDIYKAYAKSLVEQGLAYPCFCTEQNEQSRKQLQENSDKKGYYGEFAKCRNLTLEEIEEKLKNNVPFAIRLKVDTKPNERFCFNDFIKGKIEMDMNINDVVILKQNGLPPYNFAHAIDDHLMGTTLVIRGEDWLSATSEHTQIVKALGYEPIPYAHVSQIEMQDGASRRKLSKRKDKQADVAFFSKAGYTKEAIIDYLLTITSSDFEIWRASNPTASIYDFDFKLEKLSKSGTLFDDMKLYDVSKNVVSRFTADKFYNDLLTWANDYDSEFAEILRNNKERAISMFSIDRGGNKPRKDIACWSEVRDTYGYIFDELFFQMDKNNYEFDEKYSKELIEKVANHYIGIYDDNHTKDEWFANIKNHLAEINFASDMKEYKANPDKYDGNVADYTTIIRVLVTGKKNTPDLYNILQIIGKSGLINRLNYGLN